MVDRAQQQGRAAVGEPGRAASDLAWIVAIGTVAVVAVTALTLSDAGAPLRLGADDGIGWTALVSTVLAIAVGAVVYGVRRSADLGRLLGELERLDHRDPLTALPNRSFLGEPFDELLVQARRRNDRMAVAFVDLDGLKPVNEALGHEAGDAVLVAVADRLRGAVGHHDEVVRYGGDEFVLLCGGITATSTAERLAARVLSVVETPLDVGGDRVRISAWVGMALTEEGPTRADEVLSDADAALHQARLDPGRRIAVFDRSMRARLTPATAERRLREGLDRGEFRVYYQPIVSLWTKRVVGVEALLRWHDPHRGVVGPDEFMAAFEDTGLIVPVGEWVLAEVCRQSRAWHEAHPDLPALNVKVNVSARQLAQADFIPNLRRTLDTTGAVPSRVCLEVTETALMHDVDAAWVTLREAKRLGLSLALDDFGTGYSSLSHLRRFRLDVLNIDRSFVAGIGVSREDTTIVEHLVGMAKALGIVTVAEGVEREEQVDHLRVMNCDLAQGWHFGGAQPPDVIDALLRRDGSPRTWRREPAGVDDPSAPVVDLRRFDRTPATEDSPLGPR